MANETMPNMGIELPTPGVTGALGVEAPGASWMELQNEGFRKVDVHDHGANGGAPLTQDAFVIGADLTFAGFNAINLLSSRYVNQLAVLAGASDKGCVYFMGGDLYINNAAGTPVRVTNGANVAGAAGNITSLSGAAAVTWNSGLGVFIFEQSSGVKAGLYAGPLSIFEPIAGGKKVTLSAPAGLAADYALTFPAALPGSKMGLFVSSAGVATFEALAANIAAGSITKAMQVLAGPVSATQTAGVQNISSTGYTDVANVAVSITTTVANRPVLVSIQSDPAVGEAMSSFAATGSGQKATLRLLAGATPIDDRATSAEAAGTASCALPCAVVVLGAAGSYTLKLQAKVNSAGAGLAFQNLKIVAYEL